MASADFEIQMEVERLVVKEFSEDLQREANEPNILTLQSTAESDQSEAPKKKKKKLRSEDLIFWSIRYSKF